MGQPRERPEPVRTLTAEQQFRINFTTPAALKSTLKNRINMDINGPSSDFITKAVDICNAFIVDKNKATAISKLHAARDALKANVALSQVDSDLNFICTFVTEEIEKQPDKSAEAKTK